MFCAPNTSLDHTSLAALTTAIHLEYLVALRSSRALAIAEKFCFSMGISLAASKCIRSYDAGSVSTALSTLSLMRSHISHPTSLGQWTTPQVSFLLFFLLPPPRFFHLPCTNILPFFLQSCSTSLKQICNVSTRFLNKALESCYALFFMDDLKVYAKGAKTLGATLELVDRVSHAVGMELGLRKCAVTHIKQGKYASSENYLLPENQKMERVSQGGTYRYLGIELLFQNDHTAVRDRLKVVDVKCLYQVWSITLSYKHKVHAMNTWAVAVFCYFFATVKWHLILSEDFISHSQDIMFGLPY